MESKTLTLPISKNDEYGYGLAYRLACEQLAQIDDIEEQCRKSGTQYLDSPKAIVIEYLNQKYLITLANVGVSLMHKKEEVPIWDKIILLHYFTQAKGTPISTS